jgi:hypothetical protein
MDKQYLITLNCIDSLSFKVYYMLKSVRLYINVYVCMYVNSEESVVGALKKNYIS